LALRKIIIAMNTPRYGMVGWQEFASNRSQILAQYDLAKAQEASRPVRTEHGVTGEAAIRQWLGNFLPEKYRVTSGYIIPDVVQTADYKLYQHDIIIFDAQNAPVLWTEGNPDRSDQGKKRAIPARYVHAVLEVKASFGAESAKDALNKLRQLNLIASHFPPQFSCAAVFIDLPISIAQQSALLRYLLPVPAIHAFWGGVILRCEINVDMSGVITVYKNDGSPGSVQNKPELPLVKDIDQLNIFINQDGKCVMAEGAGGVALVSDGVSNWMVSKLYCPCYCENGLCVRLSWSANGFSQFALHLLSYLEGKDPQDSRYQFGQIFDHLEQRNV
jgi:hypothetical protein